MTLVRFIGDVHGKWKRYRKVIKSSQGVSLQLGDFGVGFYEPYSDPPMAIGGNPPHSSMEKGSHFFLRGNHDNPYICANHPFWVRDGEYAPLRGFEKQVWCVGGATSIDSCYRTPDYTWWEEEELSYAQWMGVMDKYEVEKPSIVATHDLPESAAQFIMGTHGLKQYSYRDNSRTRQALDNLLDMHKPAVWLHGHWHVTHRTMYKGVEFIGLAECDYLDLSL